MGFSVSQATGRLEKNMSVLQDPGQFLIEALSARDLYMLAGQGDTARYRVTWPIEGNADYRKGDVVIFQNDRYSINKVKDDSVRINSCIENFKTAFLLEIENCPP